MLIKLLGKAPICREDSGFPVRFRERFGFDKRKREYQQPLHSASVSQIG